MHRRVWLAAGAILTITAGVGVACVGQDPTDTGAPGNDGGPNLVDSSPAVSGDGGTSPTSPDAALGEAGGGPNPQCVTATGTHVGDGALKFYGSHNGIAATSNGWALAGFYRNAASYGPGGGTLGDGGDPTESASAARVDAAGNVVWQQSFGGNSSDEFTAVTVDDKDNVYVAGWFESSSFTIGATPVTNVGVTALGVVAKLDAATGNPLWARTFIPGEFGFGCGAIDFANGHLVVTCSMGLTQSYKSADGGATAILTSGQVMASSVYALDPETGNAVWADSFSTYAGADTSSETFVNSVDVTDSTVVVAGTFNGGTMTDKTAVDVPQIGGLATGFVAELTVADGLYHFAKGFGGTTDAGTVQSATAAGSSLAGGVFVGGSFSGSVDFGGGLQTSVGGSSDAYLVWLANKAGPPEWQKILGGTGSDGIRSVLIDPCGRPEVMLSANSALGKVDGVTVPAPQNGAASIIAKISPDGGALLWASGISNGGNPDTNGINTEAFAINGAGHTRVVGNFRGQIDFGSGTVTVSSAASNPYYIEYAP